ncbi:hypothetical protein IAQ61_006042 [Plenodomus lingam]|uniref:Luciferase domain-containing protein n=1 Tax=Leptosphaeria maculans (strain JN3 / isolate v23.1.3 / race Av1-4-5-6-7-8) TaxID=985895 RepID=E4ZMW6_LEPMJ|nr:hypothetical protein LEMA_P052750.1 [Plenodomus lingam JN3]KAH9870566.1 hypothetical protein IAQ61_006042 [Plenodomus lingam]CBX92569.1 hypothetical protein LEMA_P052750.1 [Plenodomus lingam JN3]
MEQGNNESTPLRDLQQTLMKATMFSATQLDILTAILTLVLPLLAAFYIRKDYKAFLDLGPGGTPSTPLGYLKIKLLSLVCLRNPLGPIPIPSHFRPQQGYFRDDLLPRRLGDRPVVRGIAPQRQQTEKSGEKVYARLVEKMKGLVADSKNQLIEQTSCFEKHSSGLFTTVPITRACGGEICHAHPSDGSMHMTMHPADANLIIRKGWGERHPLARGGWCRRFVPREFMLIYAPRDEAEVEIVLHIIAAAVWWASGVDINSDEEGSRRKSTDVEVIGKAMKQSECWACKAQRCGSSVEKMMSDT